VALAGGGNKVYCPRPSAEFGVPCGQEMKLLHIADGTEYDTNWAHCFYYCEICHRSIQVARTIEVIQNSEERI